MILDRMKRFFENLSARTGFNPGVLFIVSVMFVVVLLMLVFIGTTSRSQPQTANEVVPFDGPAVIHNTGELYKALGEDGFNLLREDIKHYARQTLDPYKTGEKEVVFMVEEVVGENNKTIKVFGKFEEVKDTTNITIALLSHGKIDTSIQTGTNTNEGLALPSDSAFNQFVGSLPKNEGEFTVDYLRRSNTFYVTFSGSVSNQTLDKVRDYFKKQLGTDDLTVYNFSAVGFDSSGSVRSYEIVESVEE